MKKIIPLFISILSLIGCHSNKTNGGTKTITFKATITLNGETFLFRSNEETLKYYDDKTIKYDDVFGYLITKDYEETFLEKQYNLPYDYYEGCGSFFELVKVYCSDEFVLNVKGLYNCFYIRMV